MDYKIVIPSYNRLETIQSKTLNFLFRHKVDETRIYIFVHPDCYDDYKNVLELYLPNINIIKSKPGIKNSRNFITSYFDTGTKIVSIDDDVSDIIDLKLKKPIENLHEFIEESFTLCPKGIWGLWATLNDYYSNHQDRYTLQTIVGTFCGYTNYKKIKLTLPVMEDYERVILFYLENRTILKRKRYAIKTVYWKEPGGIQTHYTFTERMKIQNEAADELLSRYPYLCFQQTRKSGLKDIRFKKKY